MKRRQLEHIIGAAATIASPSSTSTLVGFCT